MTKRVRNDRQMTQQSWDCVELTRKKWCFWRNKQEKNSTQKTGTSNWSFPEKSGSPPQKNQVIVQFSPLINQLINLFIYTTDIF